MKNLEKSLLVPDIWQQEAIRAIQDGKDVIVHAPTGAGKTYIFELLIENGFRGRAIYTVPTRALANDKVLEWSHKGWNVGLITGDRVVSPESPVVVATLETQKFRLLREDGPNLLVIDEYQMLADEVRGMSYEFSLANTPADTQLLLLSGSVGNPADIQKWLTRLGRDAVCVMHDHRPVPLEEIHLDALPDQIPASVRGFWPRAIARALKSEMAPLLAFAPRRKAAEELAIDLARMLPESDPIVLTPEQERIAGPVLRRLLRARIAYHHSGLDYDQRAGLVEPLAKAGQLRVVVATMGLAAGINFSMRSVLVTDRDYRHGDRTVRVRPDELLQMFGRAGRRGLDKLGQILVVPEKPRLSEARPLKLQRTNPLDWPSLLMVMSRAVDQGKDPIEAARSLAARLFSPQEIPIGLRKLRKEGAPRKIRAGRIITQEVEEFKNSEGEWERVRTKSKHSLKDCLFYIDGKWKPALEHPTTLSSLREGNPAKWKEGNSLVYGREVPIARFGKDDEGELVLVRWSWNKLNAENRTSNHSALPRRQKAGWSLEEMDTHITPRLPYWTQGGKLIEWKTTSDQLYARLHYRDAKVFAIADSLGRGLFNPETRKIQHTAVLPEVHEEASGQDHPGKPPTIAETWYTLGLILEDGTPTRRGRIVSFFNQGEGIAISSALEDSAYPVEEIILHIANLRAGHRFGDHELYSGRLGAACQNITHGLSIPGYLYRGLPIAYGDGAAEILFDRKRLQHAKATGYGDGDIERTRLEWRSIVRQITISPDLEWDRWLELKKIAREFESEFPATDRFDDFPPLTRQQSRRHKSFLHFE